MGEDEVGEKEGEEEEKAEEKADEEGGEDKEEGEEEAVEEEVQEGEEGGMGPRIGCDKFCGKDARVTHKDSCRFGCGHRGGCDNNFCGTASRVKDKKSCLRGCSHASKIGKFDSALDVEAVSEVRATTISE